MYFRWTLYNGITLAVIALTGAMVFVRFRFSLEKTWPLVYYVLVIGYEEAFPSSLSTYWIFAGLLCGLLLRFEFLGKPLITALRTAELAVLAYVVVRCLQLLLLWPW